MLDVLVSIRIIELIAKDVHYRSDQEWFYALHLLADKVDFGSAEDDIKEAYYLGQKEVLPPSEKEIVMAVAQKYPDISSCDNENLVRNLCEACANGIYAIEDAKREAGLVAGVHAILDGISQHLLVIKGLCWRTLNTNKEEDGNGNGTNQS